MFLVVVLLFFTLVALVTWIRQRSVVRPYRKYGFAAGGAIIALLVLILAVTPGALSAFSTIGLAAAGTWDFIRISAITITGIYFSSQIGHVGFPVLMRRFGGVPALTTPAEPRASTPPELSVAMTPATAAAIRPAAPTTQTGEAISVAPVASAEAAPMPIQPAPRARDWLLATGGVVAGALVWTTVLFAAASPQLSRALRQMTESDLAQAGFVSTITLSALVLVVQFAFAEELMFRLAIQNILAKTLNFGLARYRTAIVLTSALWAAGHSGQLDPDWVKLAQIFPIGLAFGWLYQKYGAESSITAHVLFNLIGTFVTLIVLS